jgi:hypothetical protein
LKDCINRPRNRKYSKSIKMFCIQHSQIQNLLI